MVVSKTVSFAFSRLYVRSASGAGQGRRRLSAVFAPAVSRSALKVMGQRVRRWKLHRRVDLELREIARWINPIVRGWMQHVRQAQSLSAVSSAASMPT